MSKVYKGDVGTVIYLDCGTDISGATTTKIMVKKPDSTYVEWTGTVDSNTKIKYTIASNDLDQSGKYILQAYVVTSSWTGRGEAVPLMVYDHYE